MRSIAVAALGLVLGVSSPSFAQGLGTFDVGAHLRYSKLDKDLDADNGIGFGGRLGVFVLRNVAIELEANQFSGSSIGGDLKLQPIYIRVAAHFPVLTGWSGIIGAAMLRDRSETPDGSSYTDGGFSLNLGVQRTLMNQLSARVDLIGDVVSKPFEEDLFFRNLKTGNIHLNFGLNYRFSLRGN